MEWISVEDKDAPLDEEVYAYWPDYKIVMVSMRCEFMWYEPDEGGWRGCGSATPSHWMPMPDLPEPPVDSKEG